jgi:hypothetical protein
MNLVIGVAIETPFPKIITSRPEKMLLAGAATQQRATNGKLARNYREITEKCRFMSENILKN